MCMNFVVFLGVYGFAVVGTDFGGINGEGGCNLRLDVIFFEGSSRGE